MKKLRIITLAALVLSISSVAYAAEEKMSYEEYQARLAECQEREATAKAQIAEVEGEIESAKSQIADANKKMEATDKEIYALIKSDKNGVEEFSRMIDALSGQIRGLQRLSGEELYKKRDEIKDIEEKLGKLKSNPISALPEISDKISGVEGMLAKLKDKMPKIAPPKYHTVVRGDNLWNIAKKEQYYNDPYMWPRIYRANKDKIKDPDLIYPKQVFTVPMGIPPGHHLVVRGEWLSKISGYANVYNDRTKWTKIYEANRDQIKDPNLILPAQILVIP